MDWYDETLTDIGITPGTTSGPGASDLSNDDILESIGMALGDSIGQDWVTQTFNGITNTAAYAQRQGIGEAPRSESDKTPSKNESKGGIIGRISDFVDKNKSLSEILLKGVAGAAAGNQAKKTAEINAQSRLDELKLKNQQEREKDAMVSASVSGLRQPTGIINRGVLKRADGTPVFQNGRIA